MAGMDLDCGIRRARLESWLADELGLPFERGAWKFTANDSDESGGVSKAAEATCRVRLSPLEARTLGSFTLERTRLTAEGDARAIAYLQQLFTLRFMSAGG